MKIDVSINLAQSHPKPTTPPPSPMVGAKVSEDNCPKKGFKGKKEVVNSMQKQWESFLPNTDNFLVFLYCFLKGQNFGNCNG